MIDQDGYRLGVGIIIVNQVNKVLLAQRADREDAWQFPQGGLQAQEEPLEAMYRELFEEVGLKPEQVEMLAVSRQWCVYTLPRKRRRVEGELVVGQRQKWFLLRLLGRDSCINLQGSSPVEFSAWQWVPYWSPLEKIIIFKRAVYQMVLSEFAPVLGITKDEGKS